MEKTYNLKIESKEFYKNINSLIQAENSDIKWTPKKQYSGFFVNGEFQLTESVGLNPFYLNKINSTVVFGNYKLENDSVVIEANFKLKNRIKTLFIFYSIAILLNLIGIFHTDKTFLIFSVSFLILIPIVDRILSKVKLQTGMTRFEMDIIEKFKKLNC